MNNFLALDGWTTSSGASFYNYIITTPSRREYLYQLKDYSMTSTTGNFLADEINNVLNEIDVRRFAAIVTDQGSNIRRARRLVNNKYNFILDIRCGAHAINLIASDLSETIEIKELIKKCSLIINFFHRSSMANGLLKKGLMAMNIEGGELKSYCKTRWGSLYNTVDSLVRAQPVFDWVSINKYI